MIAIDISALVAIALGAPDAPACEKALRSADRLIMSARTMAEALIVSGRRGFSGTLRALVEGFDIEIVPVTQTSARRVAEAHDKRARGEHPAALNFGDRFAYEVARTHECPLLFVGDDFSRTDVVRVLPDA